MDSTPESGIDVSLGDRCSQIAYSWAKRTFSVRAGRLGEPSTELDGAFSGAISFGGMQIAIASDGIGTKVELAERAGVYSTLGYDLVAMVADDLICCGAEPTSLSNVLDVDCLDEQVVNELMRGLSEAAEAAGMAVTGGEIAELGARVSGYGDQMHFNWCATALGVLRPEWLVTGTAVEAGDVILALRSAGFRCNGFSLARRILTESFGDEWHEAESETGRLWGEVLLTPSTIYTPALLDLFGFGIVPRALAHVTGGGIGGNLARVLGEHGAELSNLFPPHPEMVELQERGEVSPAQAFELWNMGNGMLVIVSPEDAEGAIEQLQCHHTVRAAGIVTEDGAISIAGRQTRPSD